LKGKANGFTREVDPGERGGDDGERRKRFIEGRDEQLEARGRSRKSAMVRRAKDERPSLKRETNGSRPGSRSGSRSGRSPGQRDRSWLSGPRFFAFPFNESLCFGLLKIEEPLAVAE
jgi:hypothetical protein